MKEREALKLALEALENLPGFLADVETSITAIKEVLEQPELCKYGQEPKSCTSSPMDCQCALDATFAQPEQEPVAKMLVKDGIGWIEWKNPIRLQDGLHDLHTNLPQRTWVGLTYEEINEWTPEIHGVIRTIEAKLKEKNS